MPLVRDSTQGIRGGLEYSYDSQPYGVDGCVDALSRDIPNSLQTSLGRLEVEAFDAASACRILIGYPSFIELFDLGSFYTSRLSYISIFF